MGLEHPSDRGDPHLRPHPKIRYFSLRLMEESKAGGTDPSTEMYLSLWPGCCSQAPAVHMVLL